MEQIEWHEERQKAVDNLQAKKIVLSFIDTFKSGDVTQASLLVESLYRRNFPSDYGIVSDSEVQVKAWNFLETLDQINSDRFLGTLSDLNFCLGFLWYLCGEDEELPRNALAKANVYFLKFGKSGAVTSYLSARCFQRMRRNDDALRYVDIAMKKEAMTCCFVTKAELTNPYSENNGLADKYMFIRNALVSNSIGPTFLKAYEYALYHAYDLGIEYRFPSLEEYSRKICGKELDRHYLERVRNALAYEFCTNHQTGRENSLGYAVSGDWKMWYMAQGIEQKRKWTSNTAVKKGPWDDYESSLEPDGDDCCPRCSELPCMCSDPGW